MSQYHYRFHIIYWVTYLEEYELSCGDYFNHKLNKVTNIPDLYNSALYEVYHDYFEIDSTSAIFHEKLGKHPETRQIFMIMGFEAVPPNDPNHVRMYRITKSRDHLKKVRKISDLLMKIATMDL